MELPIEIWTEIFDYLSTEDKYCFGESAYSLYMLSHTCKYLHDIVHSYSSRCHMYNANILLSVCSNGNYECFRYLLDTGVQIGKYRDLITTSVRRGQLEIFRYFDDIKCVDDHSGYLYEALEYGHLPIVAYLWNKSQTDNILVWFIYQSAVNGGIETLKFVYEKKGYMHRYALQHAASINQFECCKFILEETEYLSVHGYDHNITSRCVHDGDNGIKCLEYLMGYGYNHDITLKLVNFSSFEKLAWLLDSNYDVLKDTEILLESSDCFYSNGKLKKFFQNRK